MGAGLLVAIPVATGAAASVPPALQASTSSRTAPANRWIVTAVEGQEHRLPAAIATARGRVVRPLPVILGAVVDLTTAQAAVLRHSPAVRTLTPDAQMTAQGGVYDPVSDPGGPATVSALTGARAYWAAGFTGRGVDVALIDSGVTAMDGLSVDRIVHGPDLSFESMRPEVRNVDTYGHGTHMAGLIAGKATGASTSNPSGPFLGMAPDARIVSVKVADTNGRTDVSQIIAAIDWVVQNRTSNGLNIRVMNLSYGTDSDQDTSVDPLSFAVDQAWRSGIVVVAATGNAGFENKRGSMMNPARTPTVIAVGAMMGGDLTTRDDDEIATFSSNGNKDRRPDLVAPGRSIVSLRAAGSTIDRQFGATGGVSPTLFRGSGTSQATAIVSGAAALMIQQNPAITPDMVKRTMIDSTVKLKKVKPEMQGKGALDLSQAISNKRVFDRASEPKREAMGGGSLQAARGSFRLTMNGAELNGERDIFGKPFDSRAIASAQATGSSWSGGNWNGSSWSGSSWSGSSWSGSSWSGSSWSGSSWSGSSWSGIGWVGSSWSGNVWADASWD